MNQEEKVEKANSIVELLESFYHNSNPFFKEKNNALLREAVLYSFRVYGELARVSQLNELITSSTTLMRYCEAMTADEHSEFVAEFPALNNYYAKKLCKTREYEEAAGLRSLISSLDELLPGYTLVKLSELSMVELIELVERDDSEEELLARRITKRVLELIRYPFFMEMSKEERVFKQRVFSSIIHSHTTLTIILFGEKATVGELLIIMNKDKKALESIIKRRSSKELAFYSSLFFELNNYRENSVARKELATAAGLVQSLKKSYGVNARLIEL